MPSPKWPAFLDAEEREIVAQLFVLMLAVGVGLIILAAAAGLAVSVFERASAF